MSEILEDEDSTEELLEKTGKKSRGETKVQSLDQIDEDQEFLPTGIGEIDSSVGGIPLGAIMHIAGPSGVGKTTLVSQMVVFALSKLAENFKAYFSDFEGRVQLRMIRYFCKLYNVNPSRILYARPTNGEDGGTTISNYVDDPDVIITVIDSLKAIIPKATIEQNIDQNERQRAQAGLIDRILRSIVNRVAENKKSIICIDHLKEKGKVMNKYPIYETTSGETIRFFASTRWFIYPRKKITKTENGITKDLGRILLIKIPKSTVSSMASIEGLSFYFRRGISPYKWYLIKAREFGLLHVDKNGTQKSYRVGKGEKSRTVAKNKKELIAWITGAGSKIWSKLTTLIIDKEKQSFIDKLNADPEIFNSEFDE